MMIGQNNLEKRDSKFGICETILKFAGKVAKLNCLSEMYIQSAPNNSNETHTFMCLDRFGQC